MNLINFDPWAPSRRTYRTSRTMPDMFDDLFGRGIGNVTGADFATNLPSVNVSETEDGYRLDLAAPGLTKEDFKIAVEKNSLTISSERSTEDESSEGRYTRREFNYRTFSRTFVLPGTVDKDNITARYENGVLRVSVPKKPEVVKDQKGRVIEIS